VEASVLRVNLQSDAGSAKPLEIQGAN